MMIEFKTTKQKHIDGIVATLERLCSGKPVAALTIAKAYEMEHAQVNKYLRLAMEEGRVKPVYVEPDKRIRGWIPACLAADTTLFDQKSSRITTAISELAVSNNKISVTDVAKHLGLSRQTAERWLKRAAQMKLVQWKPKRGWLLA